MPEYERLPLKVTAYQFDGSWEMAQKLHQWYLSCKGGAVPVLKNMNEMQKALKDKTGHSMVYDSKLGLMEITTPNGTIELMTGDWLVQSPNHDFSKMEDDKFRDEHTTPSYATVGRPIKDSPQA